eukprot:gene11325-18598_t
MFYNATAQTPGYMAVFGAGPRLLCFDCYRSLELSAFYKSFVGTLKRFFVAMLHVEMFTSIISIVTNAGGLVDVRVTHRLTINQFDDLRVPA